jgi:hypothetical protein
LKNAYD